MRDLAQGRGLEVALGRGTVDWPEIMGLLEDHNYRGYFTLEREQSNDPLGEISAGVKYLRNL
jgi:sugar phosphate isomerase/epimerase